MPDQDLALKRRYAAPKPTAAYVGVTTMTLWRWKMNPSLNFPKPAIINDIPYYDLDAIDEWMRSRAVSRFTAA